MKFNCGPTAAEKKQARIDKENAKRLWHQVFVIWPRRVGSHDCRAFETVERRWVRIGERYVPMCLGTHNVFGWEYRAIGN